MNELDLMFIDKRSLIKMRNMIDYDKQPCGTPLLLG